MKKIIRDLEDNACPQCGRFYFMPDEELMGMRHVRLNTPTAQARPYQDAVRASSATKGRP